MRNSKLSVRTAAVLLLLAAAAGTASCGNENTPAETAAQPSSETVRQEPAETEVSVETLYSAELETKDYGGVDFKIMTGNTLAGLTLPTTINAAEEENGEVVNDALYHRQLWLAETYNVNPVITLSTDSYSAASLIQKAVMAGDNAYELAIEDAGSAVLNLVMKNCMYPLNHVDTLQMDKPYWMPETNEKLKIADNIFAAACAISPRFYGSVYVLMFNRDMARELDLPDFYSMVLDGSWTHDRFFSVAREAVSDLNGDGKMDEQDRYGFIYDYSVADAMVIGAGMRYVENNNGRLRLTLEDAPVVDYVQKLADFFQEPCCGYDDNGVRYFMGEDFVHNGTVLFYGPCTFNLASYRDLTYDYGILPMPKLDEGQDAYYCYSQPWATACPIIPITLTGADLDRVGTLTDAMAAYGYDYVRPAVFDNVIQLKSARDEQSAQIIDMMFENVTFEYVSFFRFGKMFDAIHNFYSTNLGKKDIVSTYAAVKASAESEVEKLENHILEFVAGLE